MEQSIGSAIWMQLRPETIRRAREIAREHLARTWRVSLGEVPDVEVDKFLESRVPATVEKMIEASYARRR